MDRNNAALSLQESDYGTSVTLSYTIRGTKLSSSSRLGISLLITSAHGQLGSTLIKKTSTVWVLGTS